MEILGVIKSTPFPLVKCIWHVLIKYFLKRSETLQFKHLNIQRVERRPLVGGKHDCFFLMGLQARNTRPRLSISRAIFLIFWFLYLFKRHVYTTIRHVYTIIRHVYTTVRHVYTSIRHVYTSIRHVYILLHAMSVNFHVLTKTFL